MGFTIPNYTDAVASGVGDQAEPDSVDFQILGDGTAVLIFDPDNLNNGLVTQTSTASQQVNVAAYSALIKGVHYSGAATSGLALDAGGSNPRFDLVVITSDGLRIRKGTESSTNPVFPTPEPGDVVLAAIYRPAGGGAASYATTARIVDKRILVHSNHTWLKSAAPTSNDGVNGDLWIDTSATATGQSMLWVKRSGAWENLAEYVPMASTNTANNLVLRDASGNFSANVITASLNGNATTASSAGSVAWANVTGTGSVVQNNGGTYNINITGNAATASSANTATTAGSANTATWANTADKALTAEGLGINGLLFYPNYNMWSSANPIDTPSLYCTNAEINYIGSYGDNTGAGTPLIRVSNGAIRKQSSLRSLKKNIEDYDNGLEIIKQLRPRTFNWKDQQGDTSFEKSLHADFTEHGFIVEEVEEVSSNLIHYSPDDAGNRKPDMWKANDIISILVQAVQELSARVEELEGK